jgi:hypothetical protein
MVFGSDDASVGDVSAGNASTATHLLKKFRSHPCRRCKGGDAPRRQEILQVGSHWRFRPQLASG